MAIVRLMIWRPQARNLLMDLGKQTHRVKFMIRDRGSNFTSAFDAVLTDAGIRTVLCNVLDGPFAGGMQGDSEDADAPGRLRP